MYSFDDFGEQSICQARASVMVYDDASKKWVPIKPGQQGFSRINIYHNTANNTFRVVGVKLQDQQVVINYSIVKGLKYNQATPTFHQWRDARQVYGLNFASKEEASTFSNAMLFALNVLSSPDATGPAVSRQNGPSIDDPDSQRRQMMEQHQMQAHKERERRTSGSGPPVSSGHPSSLPFVPPPVAPPAPAPMAGPPAPPPPPGPPPPGPPPPVTVPPPMPPPLPIGGGPGGPGGPGKEQQPSGLAAALAGAKLRKVQRDESSPPGSGAVKNDANRSSGGSGGGGEGLMQEMNALLARRRKASEKPEEDDNNARGPQNSTDAVRKPWERSNSADKSSLVSRVRPVGSSSEADTEFDRMKQEILDEVVRELHKVKDEIINAIRQEVGRISTT
ncbi:enah/Vasp-like a isoform X1 [Hypomesus transpacificus]|uniref:enah/Vasp-like a isoform X1 n=1 Tax=Hypomesus transpacificus TaxID=137520 RepID=UPI001F081290|nr:enah/Vasp-like a isoform X1 [Hypomesus transpacificus]XP_046874410.1 enah/Vasp-like a isoform X1 [Hypomesus transpacificus]